MAAPAGANSQRAYRATSQVKQQMGAKEDPIEPGCRNLAGARSGRWCEGTVWGQLVVIGVKVSEAQTLTGVN